MIGKYGMTVGGIALLGALTPCPARPLAIEVGVRAAPAVPVPVAAPLPQAAAPLLPPPTHGVYRANGPQERGFSVQVCRVGPWAEGAQYLAFLLPASWPAGRQRLEVDLAFVSPDVPGFRFEEAKGKYLRVFEGDRPVLTYNSGMMLVQGVPEDRGRSCYLHPLYGLDGEVLSGDFEPDHYHHRGVFWAWPRMKAGERGFSLWDLRGGQQRFEQWLGREAGPVCAVFGVRNGWYVGEERVAVETLWLRTWRTGQTGRAIDVQLTWEATSGPIEILGQVEKGYGGFNVRFGPRQDTVLTTPEGPQQDSNLLRFAWADLSARFGGAPETSGAAVLVDVGNPGFPNGWTLRNYGFLGVAWPGLEPYLLEPGKPLTVRYRLWAHRGDAQAGRVADAYTAFAHPPAVTVR